MGETKLSTIPASVRPKAGSSETALVWPLPAGAPNRHGAISEQLSSYSRYKMWVDKMRNAWRKEEEDDEDTAEVPRLR